MKLMQMAMAAAAATLLFGSVGTPVYAQDDAEPTTGCSIRNQGNGNNIACRDLVVGNNNTSGAGHTVGLGSSQSQTWTVANASSQALTIGDSSDCDQCTLDNPSGRYPFTLLPVTTSRVAVAFFTTAGSTGQAFLETARGGEITVDMPPGDTISCISTDPSINCTPATGSSTELIICDSPNAPGGGYTDCNQAPVPTARRVSAS
ncbi:hypothetical protein ACFV16_25355 [Streptomyces massasporeus]|uniref:hypothetical protein n=1 Tax=Streptomyces massasporeus TaxID=67324 RepID=UPI00368D8B04